MKSSPLSNWRTANPSEASKRPVDLSTSGSSSTRQTISASDFSTGVIHNYAYASDSFSRYDISRNARLAPTSRQDIGHESDAITLPITEQCYAAAAYAGQPE